MKVNFMPPNYRCKVRIKEKPKSKPFWMLCFAGDDAELHIKIDGLKLDILEYKKYDYGTAWTQIASRELKKASNFIEPIVKLNQKPVYKFPPLWSEWKYHIIDLFHGKCAYCEAYFEQVAFGAVEHYRPKGGVDGEPTHPGYWWLAYNPENYLPTCDKCNSYAKKNIFPVAKGTRVMGPQANLNNEKPLLINPYIEDPSMHIEFIPSEVAENGGMARGVDDKGIETIKIVLLNRQKLLDYRKREMAYGLNTFLRLFGDTNNQPFLKFIDEVQQGEREFSTAIRTEVNHFLATRGMNPIF